MYNNINMKILILLVIFLIIIYIYLLTEDNVIWYNDKEYFNKFKNRIISNLESNNKLVVPIQKKNHILIITYDNRTNIPYIILHNKNLNEYVHKWNFQYKFITKCNYNVYWCKIHLVLDELLTNKYDYVMWLDSDTYIFNMDINLSDIVNNYASDILIGSDNNPIYDITNAGVFIIRNTMIGIQYLRDCINNFSPNCLKINGLLKGKWAASCYEQGIMNLLIADKYLYYTTILSNNLIYNKDICNNNVFIMHLYASSNKNRIKCFTSNQNKNFIH